MKLLQFALQKGDLTQHLEALSDKALLDIQYAEQALQHMQSPACLHTRCCQHISAMRNQIAGCATHVWQTSSPTIILSCQFTLDTPRCGGPILPKATSLWAYPDLTHCIDSFIDLNTKMAATLQAWCAYEVRTEQLQFLVPTSSLQAEGPCVRAASAHGTQCAFTHPLAQTC